MNPTNNLEALHGRAKALNLHGLLAHWSQVAAADWVPALLDWEEQERSRRSLERRLRAAHIGRFKPICDFDWSWPKRCDRAAIEALMSLDFLREATNPILVGPNGVGKSTLAWISTEGEFPNIRNANRFTRLKNFAVAGRPIGALMEACA